MAMTVNITRFIVERLGAGAEIILQPLYAFHFVPLAMSGTRPRFGLVFE
jgi:hypothetical protein